MDGDNYLKAAQESLNLAHEYNSSEDFICYLDPNNKYNLVTSGENDSTYCKNNLKVPELGNIIKKSFPSDLTERLKKSKSIKNYGVFIELNRAWMTVDTEIFIWSFGDILDFTYFDRFSNYISTIALINPKKNVFQLQYTNLLVVTTISDLFIFGVYFGDEQKKADMHIQPDPFYVVKLDNFLVKCIEGTNDGRIFLGSEYGILYEVEYKESYGIFGRRQCKIIDKSSPHFVQLWSYFTCKPSSILQICIDNDKKMLYTRSQDNSLQAFSLKNNGCNGPHKLSSESKSYELIHIAICPALTSQEIYLVGFTKMGMRLYYTSDYNGNSFRLIHARAFPRLINNVTSAAFDPGWSVMIDAINNVDRYVITSSDTIPHSDSIVEAFDIINSLALNQCKMVIKLKEEDDLEMKNYITPHDFQTKYISSISFQHYFIQKKILFFTNCDIVIIGKLNHCEQLEHLLLTYGPDSVQIRSYFLLNQVQAFTSCLTLMTCRTEEYNRSCQLAMRTFFMFTSDQSWNHPFDQQSGINNEMLSPITPSNGLRQRLDYMTAFPPISTPDNNKMSSTIIHEDKFKNGSITYQSLYMFLDRILWPVYNRYLLNRDDTLKDKKCESTISCKALTKIISKLDNLKNLLAKYPELLNSSTSDRHNQNYNQVIDYQAALHQLPHLMDQWRQTLCLWILIIDNTAFGFMAITFKELYVELKSMTFAMLVQKGEFCHHLINILIDAYLQDNAFTDAITNELRNNCPLFYSPADKNITKAEEYLHFINSAKNQFEKNDLMRKAIENYMLACSEVDLNSMVQKLSSHNAYTGIVNIVLAAAAKIDPNNIAIHYYINKMQQTDFKSKQFYDSRMNCYRAITNALHQLKQKIDVTNSAQPQIAVTDESESYINEILGVVFKSNDQLGHIAAFNWMFEDSRKADILESNSPYVEQYLVQRSEEVAEGPAWRDTFELLCNFYIGIKKYSQASKLFHKMAEKRCYDLNLEVRVRYLSQASLCLQSSIYGYSIVGDTDLLKEIQDKIEVSSVQQEILEAVNSCKLDSKEKEKIISQLNSQLFPITELYENFATKYNLPKCKLSLVSCANFEDPTIVETIWKEIIIYSISGKHVDSFIDSITSVMLELGEKYSKLEYYFPLVYLVYTLERLSVEHNLIMKNRYFVASIFMKIGCSLELLHDTYETIYKNKDAYWSSKKQQLHLIDVACYLISNFAFNREMDSQLTNIRLVNKCKDTLSYYLIEVETAIYKDADLTARIRQLMNKLDQLYQKQY